MYSWCGLHASPFCSLSLCSLFVCGCLFSDCSPLSLCTLFSFSCFRCWTLSRSSPHHGAQIINRCVCDRFMCPCLARKPCHTCFHASFTLHLVNRPCHPLCAGLCCVVCVCVYDVITKHMQRRRTHMQKKKGKRRHRQRVAHSYTRDLVCSAPRGCGGFVERTFYNASTLFGSTHE